MSINRTVSPKKVNTLSFIYLFDLVVYSRQSLAFSCFGILYKNDDQTDVHSN